MPSINGVSTKSIAIPHNRKIYLQPSVLSAEEMRTLKECNRESFYYRCIPLSAVLSGLAYFGMKNGKQTTI